MKAPERLLILGCGYAGAALARLGRERGLRVVANVRSDARAAALRAEGFEVLQRAALDESIATEIDAGTHVVLAFPPDGSIDARLAPSLVGARSVTYLSSTGVYGEHRGVVDDTTPLPAGADGASERGARILAAEEAYRRHGGLVLRCPALYGPDRGLHLRILRGEHRIPGDGTRSLSRIHVVDLAQIVLGAVAAAAASPLAPAGAAGETMVVGDQEPASHVDVARFVCEAYGVAMPPFVPLSSVHESLRADRRVDGSLALTRFGVTLRYPTYREGMAPSATGIATAAPEAL